VYRFDRVLIDPTPEALGALLAEASAAANAGCRSRLLRWPFEDFAAFVAEWRAAPEGQRQWNGPGAARKKGSGGDTRSAAAVAWWSDPVRRRHCRVVADRVEYGSREEQDLFQPEYVRPGECHDRPVLWRVYPDDLYLRQAQGVEWWLWAACRCGATGTPESLGWMGPWCAACHDRAEEGNPPTRPGICRPVVFSGHPFWVGDLAFCPDGRTLLARVGCHPEVWVWDTVTGQVHKRLFPGRPKSTRINGLTMTPDGRKAAVCVDGWVRMWSPTDPADRTNAERMLSSRLGGVGGSSVALALSPDGTLLASASGDTAQAIVQLHDTQTGGPVRTLVQGVPSLSPGPHCLAFSPDGRTLALGWGTPRVRLWDVASGRELSAPPGACARAFAVAWSPDGKTVAATGGLWDAASGARKAEIKEAVEGLAFSPDGRLLATVGWEGILRLRDAGDGRLLGAFRWHQSSVDAVAFSPDGRWLATGGKEDRIKLWPVDALVGERAS
jgi:WD40 repeat protein